eukprot:2489439-Amphidinium_carterae.1
MQKGVHQCAQVASFALLAAVGRELMVVVHETCSRSCAYYCASRAKCRCVCYVNPYANCSIVTMFWWWSSRPSQTSSAEAPLHVPCMTKSHMFATLA